MSVDYGRPIGAPLMNVPWGLCGNREDHKPHLVTDSGVAPVFFCTARQQDRLPARLNYEAKREVR